MAEHNLTGNQGEALAATWLAQNGYRVLHQNWRHSRWEVDIIAEKDGILHFVEVKTRRSKRFGEPEESVDRAKIRYLLKAGAHYQYAHPQWKRVQYDVLSITLVTGKPPAYFYIEDIYL